MVGRPSSDPIFHIDYLREGPHKVGGLFWGDFRLIFTHGSGGIPQIIGHTPSRRCTFCFSRDLSLINVDSGMCEKYGCYRVYLEISEESLKCGQPRLDKKTGQTGLTSGHGFEPLNVV